MAPWHFYREIVFFSDQSRLFESKERDLRGVDVKPHMSSTSLNASRNWNLLHKQGLQLAMSINPRNPQNGQNVHGVRRNAKMPQCTCFTRLPVYVSLSFCLALSESYSCPVFIGDALRRGGCTRLLKIGNMKVDLSKRCSDICGVRLVAASLTRVLHRNTSKCCRRIS